MDSAFLYIWRDSKNKKFYLGFHQGCPSDGYTHSSSKMERFKSNKIPKYMKRKILAVGCPEEIYELETKLLKKILSSNKKKKYYNVSCNNISESLFEHYEAQGLVHPIKKIDTDRIHNKESISLFDGQIEVFKKNDIYWSRHKMKTFNQNKWKTVETSTKQKDLYTACIVATMLESSDRTGKSCGFDTASTRVKSEVLNDITV